MNIRQLFRVKKCMKKCQKSTCLKLTYGLFGHNYRIAKLSILYLTVLTKRPKWRTDRVTLIIEKLHFKNQWRKIYLFIIPIRHYLELPFFPSFLRERQRDERFNKISRKNRIRSITYYRMIQWRKCIQTHLLNSFATNNKHLLVCIGSISVDKWSFSHSRIPYTIYFL